MDLFYDFFFEPDLLRDFFKKLLSICKHKTKQTVPLQYVMFCHTLFMSELVMLAGRGLAIVVLVVVLWRLHVPVAKKILKLS